MKIYGSLVALLALIFSVSAKAQPLRADCVEVIQNTFAAAAGSDTLDDAARSYVHVTHSQVIATHTNPAGTLDYTYRATATGYDFTGTVVLTATRGGCLVSKVNLHN